MREGKIIGFQKYRVNELSVDEGYTIDGTKRWADARWFMKAEEQKKGLQFCFLIQGGNLSKTQEDTLREMQEGELVDLQLEQLNEEGTVFRVHDFRPYET